MNIKLLVYGSLLNAESASIGIGRIIKPTDYRDIEITGYRLNFNVLESVIVSKKKTQACFLNLTDQENATLQTKYLLISKKECQSLRIREKNYQLIKIDDRCLPHFCKNICTFVGSPGHLMSLGNQPTILIKYIRKVTDGIQLFDPIFAERFIANLEEASSFSKIIQGDYRFVSPRQNSMTDCTEI